MQLSEIIAIRNKPTRGVYIALTRRCPLLCEHCSTNSTLYSKENLGKDHVVNFVHSMTTNPPELIYLTGGEPLMRPNVVKEINDFANANAIKVVLLSGMFFANDNTFNKNIAEAIKGLSHFTASLDFYHEKQVSRENVFKALKHIRDHLHVDISLQITGVEGDGYHDALIKDIEEELGFDTSVFVTELSAVGRGKDLVDDPVKTEKMFDHRPCTVATWPVVSYTGNIVSCCNQTTVDALTPPDHLLLGNIKYSGWAEVRQKQLGNEKLRAIRTIGPCTALKQFSEKPGCTSYCGYCHKLDTVDTKLFEPLVESSFFQLSEMLINNHDDVIYTKSKYKSLIK